MPRSCGTDRVRPTALTAALGVGMLLAACGPAPDRVNPERDRLATDDVARTVLVETGDVLGVPSDEQSALADAQRCPDRHFARHHVEADFEQPVDDVESAATELVRQLEAAGLDPQRIDEDGAVALTGEQDRVTWSVNLAPDAQDLLVQSVCLDVGRVQAVEISFAERYRVRPEEPSPER